MVLDPFLGKVRSDDLVTWRAWGLFRQRLVESGGGGQALKQVALALDCFAKGAVPGELQYSADVGVCVQGPLLGGVSSRGVGGGLQEGPVLLWGWHEQRSRLEGLRGGGRDGFCVVGFAWGAEHSASGSWGRGRFHGG